MVILSLLGLTIISVVAILHETGGKDEKYAAVAVLTGVFPLMAALIGGMLAYHASLSNFAMAANALRSFASPVEGSSNIPVTSAMVETNKIVGLITLTRHQGAASITIQDLRSKFKSGVARIPVCRLKRPNNVRYS